MATTTLTLTDFLLARIAEDERALEDKWLEAEPFTEQRMRAECEAKRRIVDEAQIIAPFVSDRTPTLQVTASAYDSVLRLLALPYADHPDYDESWRP